MNDLIERKAAIDEAEEWIETYDSGRGGQRERDAIKRVIRGIKKLPSAQPEQKTGMWIGTVCSACGSSVANYYDCDYCPKCGVRMTEI